MFTKVTKDIWAQERSSDDSLRKICELRLHQTTSLCQDAMALSMDSSFAVVDVQGDTVLEGEALDVDSVTSPEVQNVGSSLLRKVNLIDFKQAMRTRWLEGQEKGTALDALNKAQATVEEARAANRKIQAEGSAFMTKWALQPMDTSAWPDDLARVGAVGGVWRRVTVFDPPLPDWVQHGKPTAKQLKIFTVPSN